MARKTAARQIRDTHFTIIGAGITEQWYFYHLQSLFRLGIKIRPRNFGEENISSLDKRIKKYATNSDVVLCDSLPSIEYWFLLHFVNTTRQFGTSWAVIAQLQKYLPGFCKNESFLKNQKWVHELCSGGKLKNAYTAAKTNGMNKGSYTNIWKAAECIGLFRTS